MKKNKKTEKIAITKDVLENELSKYNYRAKYFKILKSTIYSLIIIIAIGLILATFIFPVLEISGNSMEPLLDNSNLTIVFKTKKFESGDIISFYYGNKILVKRVIGTEGDWVNIDNLGNVYVNGELLKEDYVSTKSDNIGDITYPYQVPSSKYFVLSDNREVLSDSRSKTVGCVSEEDIIGKVFLKIWPIKELKIIS